MAKGIQKVSATEQVDIDRGVVEQRSSKAEADLMRQARIVP